MKNLSIFIVLISLFQISYAQVGIGTNNPQAKLEINGDLIVKQTPLLDATAKQLFVDSQGKVGKSDFVPSPSTAYLDRATVGTSGFENVFNSGNKYLVPLTISSDSRINTLGVTQVGNSLQVPSGGIYNVGGSVNVRMRATATGDNVYIAVNIEKLNSDGTWSAIAGVRPITTMKASVDRYYSITMPQTVIDLNANDRVRLVVYRTTAANGSLQGSPVQYIRLAGPESHGTRGYTFNITKL